MVPCETSAELSQFVPKSLGSEGLISLQTGSSFGSRYLYQPKAISRYGIRRTHLSAPQVVIL